MKVIVVYRSGKEVIKGGIELKDSVKIPTYFLDLEMIFEI